MRIKVCIDVEPEQAKDLIMQRCQKRIAAIRIDALYRRNSFFGNSKEIPYRHEVVFASIYDSAGSNTLPIKKFRKWKEYYLSAINAVWRQYYNEMIFFDLSDFYETKSRIYFNKKVISGYYIGFCETLIRTYKGRVQEYPIELTKFFNIVDYGNKYEMADYIMIELGIHINWMGKHPISSLLDTIKMKRGVLRPKLTKIIKEYFNDKHRNN